MSKYIPTYSVEKRKENQTKPHKHRKLGSQAIINTSHHIGTSHHITSQLPGTSTSTRTHELEARVVGAAVCVCVCACVRAEYGAERRLCCCAEEMVILPSVIGSWVVIIKVVGRWVGG